MAMRLSGLVSGMDTDAMIEELVSAYSVKKDKIYKQRKTLEYKQEAWKELNSKIYGFYTGTLSNMQLTSNYALKRTTSSNENRATVSASTTAVNGTQELKIKQLAKTAYLTGAKIETSIGGAVKESTKLSDLGIKDSKIKVTVGGEEKTINLKASMTMKELKAEQNVKAHKSENITVEVTDCSVPAAVSAINSIIKNLAGSEELDYTIANGAAASGETMFAIIPPTNKDFLLTDAAVLTATAKTSGADTVYTVVLVEENTTISSPVPQYNATAIGYLDLASLDLPAVTIAEADMKYPGSTVEITVNADGKVTKLVNKLPMSGYGKAQISFFNGNATFQGALDESWTFTY